MPPHLHPRSTATSTLFAGTLLASFVVVSIPHLFPCPRPRRQYLDVDTPLPSQDGDSPKQAQAAVHKAKVKGAPPSMAEEAAALKMFQEEARRLEKEARECPVPKPSGWVGRIFGFETKEGTQQSKKDTR